MALQCGIVGTIRWGCTNSASAFRRSSGTVITPTLGSIVQKGKFAACAFAFDKQLKSVDLPLSVPGGCTIRPDRIYFIPDFL